MKSVEPSSQSFLEILQLRKEFVVGDGPLGFPPDVLDCIEFRGTGREEMEFNEIFLAVEPLPDFGRFVIRCVVGDKVDLDSAVVPHQLAEKVDERRCVEHRYEARMPLWLAPRSLLRP